MGNKKINNSNNARGKNKNKKIALEVLPVLMPAGLFPTPGALGLSSPLGLRLPLSPLGPLGSLGLRSSLGVFLVPSSALAAGASAAFLFGSAFFFLTCSAAGGGSAAALAASWAASAAWASPLLHAGAIPAPVLLLLLVSSAGAVSVPALLPLAFSLGVLLVHPGPAPALRLFFLLPSFPTGVAPSTPRTPPGLLPPFAASAAPMLNPPAAGRPAAPPLLCLPLGTNGCSSSCEGSAANWWGKRAQRAWECMS